MFVAVNGTKLYFDVEGAGLVADGARMRAKPTLVLLHGGPGFDHTLYKPAFGALADVAQVIYLDQRGNGRSVGSDPETWNLAQWGDDVRAFCDALGIEQPIVFGGSFGGFVAQSYATRNPGHPGKLILSSTAARVEFETIFAAFGRLGGEAAREVRKPTGWNLPWSAASDTSTCACHCIANGLPGTPMPAGAASSPMRWRCGSTVPATNTGAWISARRSPASGARC